MIRLSERTFRAVIGGDLRRGDPAELEIGVGRSLQPGTASTYSGVAIRPYLELAAIGGLCGAGLDPVRDAARNHPSASPSINGHSLLWNLTGIAVDPKAVNVLLNLCETIGEAAGLESVSLIAPGSDSVPDLAPDDYPESTITPFEVDVDLGGRHIGVEIYLAVDPDPTALELLRADLEIWGMVGSLGGFRWAGKPTLAGVVLVHELPPPQGRLFAFDLLNTTAHPGAFDSLVGVLARASALYLPIEEVRIES